MNIAICNEQKDYLNLIEKKIKECYHDEMVMKVYAYDHSYKLLRSMKTKGYQLVFIEMTTEGTRGIEIARRIKKKNPGCRIIFISETKIRIHEAFEVGAFHYIERPIDTPTFQKVLDAAVEDYKEKDISFFLHTSQSKNCILNTKDIKYIETYYHDLKIVMHDRVYRTDVKNRYIIRPYLLPRHFLQVNQSVLVNMDEIDFMTTHDVILKNREHFSISQSKVIAIQMKYDAYKKKQDKLKELREKKDENSDM